jgi:hypothetical protein
MRIHTSIYWTLRQLSVGNTTSAYFSEACFNSILPYGQVPQVIYSLRIGSQNIYFKNFQLCRDSYVPYFTDY